MRKSIINKTYVGVMALFLSANFTFAQQGIGTDKPNKASVLDLTSSSKGMLFPRVSLVNTSTFLPVTGISANEWHTANSMMVYNTATSGNGETAVKPGFYYWEKPTANVAGYWRRLVSDVERAEWILKGDVVGTLDATKVEKIQNVPVTNSVPTSGQVLQYNGNQWAPTNLPNPTVTNATNGLSLNGTTVELGGNLTKSTTINQNGKALTIQTGGSNLGITGLNKSTVQSDTDYLMSVGSDQIVKAVKASLPKFFYMPSMMLPLTQDQIVSTMQASYSNGVFKIDLYKVYAEQFGGTNAVTSTSNPTKTTSLPVLPSNELDYYITFFDPTVYTNVVVTNEGILTYKIAANADPNDGSFMNIVFAVKP